MLPNQHQHGRCDRPRLSGNLGATRRKPRISHNIAGGWMVPAIVFIMNVRMIPAPQH